MKGALHPDVPTRGSMRTFSFMCMLFILMNLCSHTHCCIPQVRVTRHEVSNQANLSERMYCLFDTILPAAGCSYVQNDTVLVVPMVLFFYKQYGSCDCRRNLTIYLSTSICGWYAYSETHTENVKSDKLKHELKLI